MWLHWKSAKYGISKITKYFSKFCSRKKIYWAKEWYELCCAVKLNPDNMDSTYDMCSSVLEKEYITSARNSQSHDMYSKLHYNTITTLIQNYKPWPASLIIKAICGMLNTNARSFLFNIYYIFSTNTRNRARPRRYSKLWSA